MQRVAITLALALGVFACGSSDLPAPPEALIGTWRTDAPGYERSYLEIDADLITIGMGPFELYRHQIERVVHTVDRRGHDRYELHYTAAEGYADSIELTLEPANPPTVTLKHPAHPWRRDS